MVRNETWCLATDIDATLLGDDEAIPKLREAVRSERKRLESFGAHLYWVIATGRHLHDTAEVLGAHGFRANDFDAFVTAVGAEVYHIPRDGSLVDRPDPSYRDRLDATGFDDSAVRRVLAGLSFVSSQPDYEQFPHKVSYFAADIPANRQAVAAALSTLPFPTLTVWAHGQYLDVAPVTGLKGGGVHHLVEKWGLEPNRVVAAGDSGNDLSMLDRDWIGIVPAGYQAELEILRGRRNVYFAMRLGAGGVLEGLRHFEFLPGSREAKAPGG